MNEPKYKIGDVVVVVNKYMSENGTRVVRVNYEQMVVTKAEASKIPTDDWYYELDGDMRHESDILYKLT